jgi:hypothetical protein
VPGSNLGARPLNSTVERLLSGRSDDSPNFRCWPIAVNQHQLMPAIQFAGSSLTSSNTNMIHRSNCPRTFRHSANRSIDQLAQIDELIRADLVLLSEVEQLVAAYPTKTYTFFYT